ncbi:anhydro-N-acetylmuramic acid kinase [Thiomicrorhabdus sp.]|uniref:anhydro-N-acetylmuramic acid kinase n=1 Tax=Thiomicrorhabdus sp. TaxID=2039724 RepID=UPI0029C6891F|nr:anhydro-N-acetylmuramic acid kinase [Thiomicrorhabdus sp.]
MSSLYIGLMSGTSADGIDAALVEISSSTFRLRHFLTYPIQPSLKQRLLRLNIDQEVELKELCSLQNELGQMFAAASLALLEESSVEAQQITAIGSHGQTLYHAPEAQMSLQIGHPAIIAKQTGIQTAADFRIDDLAVGGQGAPFAPAFHQRLFQTDETVLAVNIGGIANISVIPGKTNSTSPLSGFDTGPGNCLIDEVCLQKFNQEYDRNGQLASQGNVHSALLQSLISDPYFLKPAPKSSGRDYFNLSWLNSCLQAFPNLDDLDLLATVTELTAVSIANEVNKIQTDYSAPLWVCGGGAYNPYLMGRLQNHLPQARVISSREAGIEPDAVEAVLFAWLAYQRIHNLTVPLKDVTGAERDVILGGIWQP